MNKIEKNIKELQSRWLTQQGHQYLVAVIRNSFLKTSFSWENELRDLPRTAEVDGYRDLRYAPLAGSQLGNCDFSRADLTGVNFDGCYLNVSNFEDSILCDASMGGAIAQNCNYRRARLTQANLTEVNFQGSDFSYSDLSGAILWGADLYDVNLIGAILDGAVVYSWRIPRVKWCNVDGSDPATGQNLNIAEHWDTKPEFMNLSDLIIIDPWGVDSSTTRVFMSYAWDDKESVLAVDQELRNRGIVTLLDQRDFILGAQIADEIERTIATANRVIVFYSRHSANRKWPVFERKLAQTVNRTRMAKMPLLIYFCLDETELPMQDAERIYIPAYKLEFKEACNMLYDAIIPGGKKPTTIDVTKYYKKGRAPWHRKPKP